MSIADKFKKSLLKKKQFKTTGKVENIIGLSIHSIGPVCNIGELCEIKSKNKMNAKHLLAEVIGFKDGKVELMPIGDMSGIGPGDEVLATGHGLEIKVSDDLLGRVIDGIGNPRDGKGEINADEVRSIYAIPPDPLTRKRITESLSLGISAIDGVMTFGKGQRMGVFLVQVLEKVH